MSLKVLFIIMLHKIHHVALVNVLKVGHNLTVKIGPCRPCICSTTLEQSCKLPQNRSFSHAHRAEKCFEFPGKWTQVCTELLGSCPGTLKGSRVCTLEPL